MELHSIRKELSDLLPYILVAQPVISWVVTGLEQFRHNGTLRFVGMARDRERDGGRPLLSGNLEN